MDGVNRDMGAIGTTTDEVHDITGWSSHNQVGAAIEAVEKGGIRCIRGDMTHSTDIQPGHEIYGFLSLPMALLNTDQDYASNTSIDHHDRDRNRCYCDRRQRRSVEMYFQRC